MRTPLNAIIGFSSVLLEELPGELNDEQRAQLSIVNRSGLQLLEVVSEVIDIAQIEGGLLKVDLQRVQLNALLHEQVDALATEGAARKLNLNFECRHEPIHVLADARRLGQVIRNLLSNAVKFTDTGSVTVTLVTEDDTARITIEDTGIGIPSDQHHQLFKPFHRVQSIAASSRAGAGLGLSIAKRLIEAMGGGIGIESRHDSGTRAWCTIPLAID